MDTKNFDISFKQFLSEKNPQKHRVAVEALLSTVELDDAFSALLDEDNYVDNFISIWEHAGKTEKDPNDRDGLKKLGKLARDLYQKKDYRGLIETFFDVTLRHLVDFVGIKKRSDYEDLTDHDLYKKSLIPSEIFLQYFLIESMAKIKDFNWERGGVVAEQNIACMIVCFNDIYDFLCSSD